MHPEVTMTCSPMALVLDAWERGDNEKLRAFFKNSSIDRNPRLPLVLMIRLIAILSTPATEHKPTLT